jgi:hypothetical protein
MPYTINDDHSECDGYAVVKEDAPNGEVFGCHSSPSAAGAQIGAIEESENKSIKATQEEIDQRFQDFNDTVNMSASEIEQWGETECSNEASQNPEQVRQRVINLLQTNKDDWGDDEYEAAGRVISFVSRMRGVEQGDSASENCDRSERDISLMNWGYDPTKTLKNMSTKQTEIQAAAEMAIDQMIDDSQPFPLATETAANQFEVDVEAVQELVKEKMGFQKSSSSSSDDFTKKFEEGDLVMWDSSGGTARGRVERVVTEGELDVPDADFTLNSSEENPAVLITVAQEDEDGAYELSETMVGHRMETLQEGDFELKVLAGKTATEIAELLYGDDEPTSIFDTFDQIMFDDESKSVHEDEEMDDDKGMHEDKEYEDKRSEMVSPDHLMTMAEAFMEAGFEDMSDDLVEMARKLDDDGEKTYTKFVKAKQVNSIKVLSDDDEKMKVGGYLIRFTDQNNPDLEGDFFTKSTNFGPHRKTLVFYDHGQNKQLKRTVLDEDAEMEIREDGVWIEAELDKRQKYERMIASMVQKGKVGWSSGTAPHLVDKERKPNGAYEIKKWFLGLDATLTPTPAEHRNTAELLS